MNGNIWLLRLLELVGAFRRQEFITIDLQVDILTYLDCQSVSLDWSYWGYKTHEPSRDSICCLGLSYVATVSGEALQKVTLEDLQSLLYNS